MQAWVLAAAVAAGVGVAGVALAQGDVVAERRTGLREMQAHIEAIGAIVQSRGDQRQIVERVDQMVPFYRSLPGRFPAATLTPPVAQGTEPGQTRALAAIEANRAVFGARAEAMVAALGTLRTAAAAGSVTPDAVRSTIGTCIACHRDFRGR
ncbi:cytochrome c [Falsiroseomonas sp.]|uniref:cytochrome c n=1 Tax=Falsiroseomonas sp. TaxID=2870721 RepID=UPI0035697FB8